MKELGTKWVVVGIKEQVDWPVRLRACVWFGQAEWRA